MKKKFEKWYRKIMKGEEGFEGITFEKNRLLHSAEQHFAELETVKIRFLKKGKVTKEISFEKKDLDENTPLLRIFLKKYSELFLSTDAGKTQIYFGDDTRYCNANVDEILIYIKGEHGCFILHGREGQKLQYLSNIGTGDATEFMFTLYENALRKCEVYA